ncbi:hypothetical protein [Nocardioides panacisoli]|uniref:Uncharacterized protein n=1 Tax=Nocardioides panacisoli TaxID=627624 RepID=A0ABP7J7P1_9ACTN
MTGRRPADLARLGLGAAALLDPRAVLRASGAYDRRLPRRLTRLLGLRVLAQAAAGLAVRDRRVPLSDAVVELTHAATTLGLAALSPGYRRLALTSGIVAACFAAADLRSFASWPPREVIIR